MQLQTPAMSLPGAAWPTGQANLGQSKTAQEEFRHSHGPALPGSREGSRDKDPLSHGWAAPHQTGDGPRPCLLSPGKTVPANQGGLVRAQRAQAARTVAPSARKWMCFLAWGAACALGRAATPASHPPHPASDWHGLWESSGAEPHVVGTQAGPTREDAGRRPQAQGGAGGMPEGDEDSPPTL